MAPKILRCHEKRVEAHHYLVFPVRSVSTRMNTLQVSIPIAVLNNTNELKKILILKPDFFLP